MASNKASIRTSLWQQRIEAWQCSQQTQKAFCQAQQLDYDQFGYYRRKFRRQANPELTTEHTGFVPVSIQANNDQATLSLQCPNGFSLSGITGNNLSVVYQIISHLA